MSAAAPRVPVTHLRLPLRFPAAALAAEVESLLTEAWIPHFNRADYRGEWNSIPLYAPGGDAGNIFASGTDRRPLQPTVWLTHCPQLRAAVAAIDCSLLSVRLLRLGVGAEIRPHRDDRLGYEDGCFRLHVPILTNPDVEFLLDGESLSMQPGECWYTNVNYEHSVANRGRTDRVHLVIDGQRNAWSDALFFSLVPEADLLPPPTEPAYPPETLRLMIEQLTEQDNPAARRLVSELTARLAALD